MEVDGSDDFPDFNWVIIFLGFQLSIFRGVAPYTGMKLAKLPFWKGKHILQGGPLLVIN